MSKDKKITTEYLSENGFRQNPATFEDLMMPYYVKEGVCLFYNDSRLPNEEHNYLIGYAEMRMGKYYATTFRWISDQEQFETIFLAIQGRNLKE